MANQRPLTHNQVEQLLAAYRDLLGWEQAAVAEHLATCPDCAKLAEEIRQVDLLLKNTAWKRPDPRLAANFYAAVEKDGRSWLQSLSRLGSQSAGIAVLLLVVLSAWLVFRNRPTQTPVETPTAAAVSTTVPAAMAVPAATAVPAAATVPAATTDPGTPLSPRYILTDTVTLFAFSPEGSYLATVENGRIHLREGSSGKHYHTISEEIAPIESLAFTPNGVYLIARDTNGRFHRWLAFNGAYQQALNDAQSPVGSSFAVGNTRLVLVTAENDLELWPLSGSRPNLTIETAGTPVSTVAVSPDGQVIAAVFLNDAIVLWDAAGNEISRLVDAPAAASGLVLTNNGRSIAAHQNGSFQVWQENTFRRQLPSQPSSTLGAVVDLLFVSGEEYLMVGYEKGFIQTWNINSGELIRTFYSGPAVQAAIGLIRNGFLYTTLDSQGTLTVWNKPPK